MTVHAGIVSHNLEAGVKVFMLFNQFRECLGIGLNQFLKAPAAKRAKLKSTFTSNIYFYIRPVGHRENFADVFKSDSTRLKPESSSFGCLDYKHCDTSVACISNKMLKSRTTKHFVHYKSVFHRCGGTKY